MDNLRTRWRFQSSWAAWLGMLCIALVLFSGIVQVIHTHPDGRVAHEDCSLCFTAHNIVQPVAVAALQIAVHRVVQIVVAKETAQPPRQRFLTKLAIRPPPALPVLA